MKISYFSSVVMTFLSALLLVHPSLTQLSYQGRLLWEWRQLLLSSSVRSTYSTRRNWLLTETWLFIQSVALFLTVQNLPASEHTFEMLGKSDKDEALEVMSDLSLLSVCLCLFVGSRLHSFKELFMNSETWRTCRHGERGAHLLAFNFSSSSLLSPGGSSPVWRGSGFTAIAGVETSASVNPMVW